MLGWSIIASACRSASNRASTPRESIPDLDQLERHLPLDRFGLARPGRPSPIPPSPITSTSVYRPAMTVPISLPVGTTAAQGARVAAPGAVVASGSVWSSVPVAPSGRDSPVAMVRRLWQRRGRTRRWRTFCPGDQRSRDGRLRTQRRRPPWWVMRVRGCCRGWRLRPAVDRPRLEGRHPLRRRRPGSRAAVRVRVRRRRGTHRGRDSDRRA